MTVAELLTRISSEELTEWMAFSQFEPFGIESELLGHAITASTVANVNRDKDTRAYKVAEFIPKFREPEQTTDEMLNVAQMFTLALGGQDLRTGEEDHGG